MDASFSDDDELTIGNSSEHETPKRFAPVNQREQQCERHGVFTATEYYPGANRWTQCLSCTEERTEQIRAEEETVRQLEESRRAERIRRNRLEVSGMVGRMLTSSFDNFDVPTEGHRIVRDTCQKFVTPLVAEDGGGLWLLGAPGTGKTHLGSAMVSHVINLERKRACIYSARELIRMLRASWGGKKQDYENADWWKPQTEDEIVEYVGTAALFVIDEIGTSFNTDAERTQLFDIIDLRYKHSLPTVLISNLDASGIRSALGERSFDRLRESAQVLGCTWPSHRK